MRRGRLLLLTMKKLELGHGDHVIAHVGMVGRIHQQDVVGGGTNVRRERFGVSVTNLREAGVSSLSCRIEGNRIGRVTVKGGLY